MTWDLFHISDELQALVDEYEVRILQGQDPGTLASWIEEKEQNLEAAILELGRQIKNWQAEEGAIKAHMIDLKGRLKAIESSIDRTREVIIQIVDSHAMPKTTRDALVSVSVRKSPDVVHIERAEIPESMGTPGFTVTKGESAISFWPANVKVKSDLAGIDHIPAECLMADVYIRVSATEAKKLMADRGVTELPGGVRLITHKQTVSVSGPDNRKKVKIETSEDADADD